MTADDPHDREEAAYQRFAALLGVPVETPPTEERRVLVPVAEVERLRALAAHKPTPTDDDSLYERHRSMILGGAS